MKEQHDGLIRAQVQLESEQHRRLKALAADRGVSVAQLVREGVQAILSEDRAATPWDDVFEIVGKYGRGEPPEKVGREHDRFLDEAFGDWREST
ncbi:MAG TPA: CopG family transcriptional regulator [Gemmatimonadota bacterium]|nr:CopG family transcriptional regulator [Gemmatimonadota bacterium]